MTNQRVYHCSRCGADAFPNIEALFPGAEEMFAKLAESKDNLCEECFAKLKKAMRDG